MASYRCTASENDGASKGRDSRAAHHAHDIRRDASVARIEGQRAGLASVEGEVLRKVSTYDRLHRHVRAWAEREIDGLVVLGRPGTGKSHAFRDALSEQSHHLFSTRKTPIQVYIELHDDPDCPVVFDDVSALLRDNNFLDMLKNLCDTGTRTIRWGTSTPLLQGRANEFVVRPRCSSCSTACRTTRRYPGGL